MQQRLHLLKSFENNLLCESVSPLTSDSPGLVPQEGVLVHAAVVLAERVLGVGGRVVVQDVKGSFLEHPGVQEVSYGLEPGGCQQLCPLAENVILPWTESSQRLLKMLDSWTLQGPRGTLNIAHFTFSFKLCNLYTVSRNSCVIIRKYVQDIKISTHVPTKVCLKTVCICFYIEYA